MRGVILTQVKGGADCLMQLKARLQGWAYLYVLVFSETVMPESLRNGISPIDPMAADAAEGLIRTNRSAVEFMFGAQKLLLDELIFAANEIFDRAQIETQLLSEFISKTAASHSVNDWKTMFRECSQHQIDFIRRDSERVFKHGQNMRVVMTNFLTSQRRAS
jgi:hypothetical protein